MRVTCWIQHWNTFLRYFVKLPGWSTIWKCNYFLCMRSEWTVIVHNWVPKAWFWGNFAFLTVLTTTTTLKTDHFTVIYSQFINKQIIRQAFLCSCFFSGLLDSPWPENHPPDSLPDQRFQISPCWQLTQEFAVAAGEQTICVPRRSAEHHKTAAIKSEAMKRHTRTRRRRAHQVFL